MHGAVPAKSIAAGGSVGAVAAGVGVALTAVTVGPVMLWMASPVATLAGGVAGGFLGAMTSRGFEKELANFYQQAVADGKILVAAEDHGPHPEPRLAIAAQILTDVGAEPLPLPEG